MRYLTKLILMVLLLLPASVWAEGICSNVKADGDFSVTVTIEPYDSNQTYDLVIDPKGASGSNIKVWSNQYDPNDPALINPTNSDLPLVDGEKYQIRFNYVAETSNSGTITYYLKQGDSDFWNEVDSAELTIVNNSQNDVTVSGNATVDCSEGEVPETPVEPDFDMCDYFPEPAQGWIGSNSILSMTNAGGNNGSENDSYIQGWSEGFILENTTTTDFNGKNINILKTGFDDTTDPWQLYNSGDSCGDSACSVNDDSNVDARKALTPTLIEASFSSSDVLSFDGDDYKDICSNSSLCQFSADPNSGSDLVTITSSLQSLTIGGEANGHLIVEFQDGIEIENFTSTRGGTDVELRFFDNSTVTFGSFILGGGSGNSFTFGEMARINIVNSWALDNSISITTTNPVVIYAPDASFAISSENDNFYGYILAKEVYFENAIRVHGSVTSNNLVMKSGVKIIGDSSCQTDPNPPATYTLDVTPDNQFALLCEAPEITFTVFNDDGSIATDYDGTITANYPTGLTPLAPTTGTQNSEYVYTPNQGKVVVPVEATSLQEYTVNAELTDDSDASDSGKVLFGPYKFAADPVKAVAGHPTQFDVQVLACKDDEVTEVQGYNGDKDLTISDIELTKPTINQGAVDGGLEVSAPQSDGYSSSDVTLDFTDNAKSQAYLKYNESGSLNFTLTDPEFVCPPEYDGCEVTNDDGTSENITSLQGIVNVDVRPWTFAICDENSGSDLPNGNSDGGDKFIAAGDEFSLQVKPIVWQDGGSLTGDIDVGHDDVDYCNARVTQNFLLPNAQPATVLMGSTLATPTQGRLGSGIQADEDGSLERAHDAVNSGEDHYTYTDLTWQEVGSLNITADTNSDDYLGMNINQGYREIGRFYPHHFRLENDNVWNYAGGHSGFAYMNQPIPMDYRVKAKSANGINDTENYGYFGDSLKAVFNVEAIERDDEFDNQIEGDSLNNRISQGPNQADNTWNKATYEFISNDFMFLKILLDSSPYLSAPDGPYSSTNSAFGVAVDTSNEDYTNDDQVNFDKGFVDTSTFIAPSGLDNLGVTFMHQPNFRYGRMVLDAVSGPIGGPISVPLRVEYWDGASFVVNNDDNGSQFKTDVYYVMSNVENSSAKLNSTEPSSFITVANGKSSRVQAEQGTAQREQVRLFLRQGNDSGGYGNNSEPEDDDSLNATNDGWKNSEDIDQPWLQFNWRDKGDEDPSTVVNFGAYRGNDRIIFRGESNLTGK